VADSGRARQLRFGILCDGKRLQLWQLQCLEELRALPDVVPAVLLVREIPGGAAPASGLFRWLSRLDPASPACMAELPEHLGDLPVVDLEVPHGAGGVHPAVESIAALRAHRLDFILSFSTAAARPFIEHATYGVWTFEFGDWERFRGAPPGFWEVYRDAPLSGAMLARLTADQDVVIPLRRGTLRTIQFSYQRNRDQLLCRFTHWPAQVCREILRGDGACLESRPVRASAAINTIPCNAGVTRFVCRMLWYIMTRGLRSWLEQDHWNIGIVEQPITDFIDPECERRPVKWLPAPAKGQFVADPFGLIHDGRLTIFCEYLDYREGVGTIAAIQPSGSATPTHELTRGAPLRRVPVTIGPVPPVHLSYPAVFEHEGQILCIPESQGAREVALYALERFPDKWKKIATLIDNAAIVDATLFRHGDLWWLAGASDFRGPAQMGADLHLWYASEITGPWIPHPDNPVKTDVCSARPAGTPFVSGGALYRPAQDSSTTYGSRVVINRIQILTPTAFREEAVAFVEPDVNGPYPDGLHTLCAVGGMTLVDGKRLELAPAEFRRVIGRMVLRRLRKLLYRIKPGRRPFNSERHNSA
jgi:hypothetical protein